MVRKVVMIFLFCSWFGLNPGCSYSPGQDNAGSLPQDSLKWDRPRFSERQKERDQMVDNDIANYPYYPIREKKVLEAMRNVPRHKFIPSYQQRDAYKNYPLSIGYGQTISQPFIVAHMTELLDITPGDKILEVGTGSGYQAAVLSELTPNVYSVEIIPELGLKAKKLLSDLGYHTISIRVGDGYDGWEEHAPFDGIIVTCAPNSIPEPLIRQLKAGGRIVIPVGSEYGIQNLVVVEKDNRGRIRESMQYPVRFVPMTGKASEKKDD